MQISTMCPQSNADPEVDSAIAQLIEFGFKRDEAEIAVWRAVRELRCANIPVSTKTIVECICN